MCADGDLEKINLLEYGNKLKMLKAIFVSPTISPRGAGKTLGFQFMSVVRAMGVHLLFSEGTWGERTVRKQEVSQNQLQPL